MRKPTKTCPTCGEMFRRRPPPSKPNGYTYCTACESAKVRAYGKGLTESECEDCGVAVKVRRQTVYQARSDARNGSDRPHRVLCGGCGEARWRAAGEAARVYPINPAGKHLCRAPVPGGCDHPRKTGGKRAGSAPLCHGHDKRRTRGRPIDTPINETMSRSHKAAAAKRKA